MDWPLHTLESLCAVFTDGDWIESKNQSPEGIRLIQTGNVGEGVFKDRRDKSRFISEDTFSSLKCCEIFEGDCLISRLPDPVGRACILPATSDRMITAVDCTILRHKKDQLLPDFFKFFSQSDAYLKKVESLTSGATRKRISRKNLGLIEVPVPPIPEQKRIVAILDQVFADIEQARAKTEQNLKNARELFESYLQQVFSQRGEGWEEDILSNICDVRDGTHDSPKYVESGIPFVTQKNIRNDGLCFDKTKFITELDHQHFYKRSNVSRGDLLISMIGANRGMVCLVDDKRVFSIKNVGLIKSSQKIDMLFLLYYLHSSLAKNYIESESRGGAQPFIGLTKLRSFPIIYSPLDEQGKIVSQIRSIDTHTRQLVKIYERKLESLTELKKSILQKAFIGELTRVDKKTENKGAAA